MSKDKQTLKSLKEHFEAAGKRAERLMHDGNINMAAVTGAPTGYIARADQYGYHAGKQNEVHEQEEKKSSDYLFLTTIIADITQRIAEGLELFALLINDLYDEAKLVLDEITRIQNHINDIHRRHEQVMQLMAEGNIPRGSSGAITDKDVSKMLSDYQKRTGKDLPETDAALIVILQEQIDYERSVLVPWLESKVDELSNVHDEVITGAQEGEKSLEQLEQEYEEVKAKPDSEEKRQELENLDHRQRAEREDAERIKVRSATQRTNIKEQFDAAMEYSIAPESPMALQNAEADVWGEPESKPVATKPSAAPRLD